MEARLVDKVYSFAVDAQNTPYNKKFDLDKNVKLVRGIILSSDKPSLLFYRGSQRIEISGDEIFPEDFESKLAHEWNCCCSESEVSFAGQWGDGRKR